MAPHDTAVREAFRLRGADYGPMRTTDNPSAENGTLNAIAKEVVT
jgi:hypothetical protein